LYAARIIAFMRMRAIGCLLLLMMATAAFAQFGETITVSRVLVDVRVTDDRGRALQGLTPADFIVTIGGVPANVESVTFVDEATGWIDDVPEDLTAPNPSDDTPADALPPARKGRLFVVFVQTDFARNASRVSGQLHFNRYIKEFLESLLPDDRVAVLSFDSHLKFQLDFTSDKERVSDAVRRSILIDEPPPPPIVHSPALASRLDREEMKRVTSSESALLLIGNALIPIDGPKNLLLLGWGLGERTATGVAMRREWKAARRALDAARATLFAFDTSFADYHDLEVGLQAAAKQTGGFYAKTHLFPEIGLDRLEQTLRARYELELRVPGSLQPGTHDLDVRTKRRGATVLAPSSIVAR
jgi:VWFA-related protein